MSRGFPANPGDTSGSRSVGASDSGEEAESWSAGLGTRDDARAGGLGARDNARTGGLDARVDAGTGSGAAGDGHSGNMDRGQDREKDRLAGD